MSFLSELNELQRHEISKRISLILSKVICLK